VQLLVVPSALLLPEDGPGEQLRSRQRDEQAPGEEVAGARSGVDEVCSAGLTDSSHLTCALVQSAENNGTLMLGTLHHCAMVNVLCGQEDVLSLGGVPPDASAVGAISSTNGEDPDEDSGNDSDDEYCEYCNQNGHSESACPLLNVNATAKEAAAAGPQILSSQDASLMEGLIEDDIVRKSFLVSLSGDLLAATESDKSPFATAQTQRTALLATLHAALLRSRNATRASKEGPDVDELSPLQRLIKSQTSAEEDGTHGTGKMATSSTSLLLQMCVELLRSSIAVSADSAICLRILDTLSLVLAAPTPLSLRYALETAEWATSVVGFLISVASASASSSDSKGVSAMQKRAVMLLLHLILQMGSLLTALRTVKLLGLNAPGSSNAAQFLTPSEYREYFRSFVSLEPRIGINACINKTNTLFLAEWKYKFPNDNGQAALVVGDDKKKGSKNSRHNRFFGRGRGRGRRAPRRQMLKKRRAGGDDDEDGEDGQLAAFDVAMASSGDYVFLHSSDYGLAKVGTGARNTRRGHTYAHLPEFGKDEQGSALAYVVPFLYYRASSSGAAILKLSADTLEIIEEINLAKKSGLNHINADSPLLSCHRYLYLLATQVNVATAAVAPAPASLSLHASAEPVVAVEARPKKRHPVFEVVCIDPNDDFKVIRRSVLFNPSLRKEEDEKSTDSNASISTAVVPTSTAAKRASQTCQNCKVRRSAVLVCVNLPPARIASHLHVVVSA
jgi:hypothetical protein